MKLSPVFGYLDFDNIWFLDLDSGVMHPQLRNVPEALSATELTWISLPANTEISEGTEEPDFTDGVIHAEYKYGPARDISVTSDMVSGFDGTTVGRQTLTVEHCGKALSFDVNVVHDYEDTVMPPTCTSRGYTTHTCSVCGSTYKDKYTDKLTHVYTASVTEPTCTAQGYTTHTCSLCGDTYIDSYTDKCAHTYTSQVINAACTSQGYTEHTCSLCGDSYIDAYTDKCTHTYTSVVFDATCTTQGYTKYICSVCGSTYISDYTEPCEHRYESDVVDPDCVNGGYTVHTCKDCGHTYTDNPTSCSGHDYAAVITPATCQKKGYTTYTCKDCGASYVGDYTVLAEHHYTTVVKEPTCSSIGYTTYTCTVCGDSHVDNYTECAEHTYTERKVLSTCSKEGYTIHICKDCGYEYVSDHIPASEHNYEAVVTDPTCEGEGFTTYTCTVCGYSYKTDFAERKGHDFGAFENFDSEYHIHTCSCGKNEKLQHNWSSGLVTKKPTNAEKGETVYVCVDCGAVRTESIPVITDNAKVYSGDVSARVGKEFSAIISASEVAPSYSCGVWFEYDKDVFEYIEGTCLLESEPEILDIDGKEGLAAAYEGIYDINGDIADFKFKIKDDADEGTYFIEYYCVFENENHVGMTYTVKVPVAVAPAYVRGDVNDDGSVNSADAIYLLRNTMRAGKYPINQSGDMNGDKAVNSADAIYLLRYTMRPSKYPLAD